MTTLGKHIPLRSAAAAGGLLVLLLGYTVAVVQAHDWWEGEPQPKVRTQTDTVQVDRTITKRDTVTETVPRTVVRYDTVQEVDTVTVAVPTDMTLKGLIGPKPVDITGEEVTLTYYDSQGGRWTQNRYDIPQDTWHLWPAAEIRTTPLGLQADAHLNLRWQKVTLSAGYMQAADRRGVTASIELRPFTLSW